MKQFKLLSVVLLALLCASCECPFLDDLKKQQPKVSSFYADKLPGVWQCYYPMYVGNVEFKEVFIYSDGKADIIMEDVGGSAYYAKTFSWRYDSNYLTFTRGNTVYQFQITGWICPELSLRDSFGNYKWAWRAPEPTSK